MRAGLSFFVTDNLTLRIGHAHALRGVDFTVTARWLSRPEPKIRNGAMSSKENALSSQ